MRPSVKLIEGGHLTGTDKSNIVDCIEFLRKEENHSIWVGRKGSPKQYAIGHDGEDPTRWNVLIRETYRTDFGQKRCSETRYVVQIEDIAPLPVASRDIAQGELFG